MRLSIVVTGALVAGAAIVASAARRPLREAQATGALPGRWGSWLNAYLARPTYRLMAAGLDLTPEDDVLDVACGSGDFLAVHAAQARRVAGIDLSEGKVALARERLANRIASGAAQVVQGDAANLPWEEATFSAVTCMDAFEYFPAPDRVLAEVRRVLRPGGRIVMTMGMKWPHGRPERLLGRMADFDYADEAAVRTLVEDAGFGEVSISYGQVGGENRLANLAWRLALGSDEHRLVRAVKPGGPTTPTAARPAVAADVMAGRAVTVGLAASRSERQSSTTQATEPGATRPAGHARR